MLRLLALFVATLFVMPHAVSQSASPWQGEWGAFDGGNTAHGRRLSIFDCAANTCAFTLTARQGNAETSGTAAKQRMQMQSGTEASAQLPDGTGSGACLLQLHRTDSAIHVTATGAACTSYYSTSAAISMTGDYPHRSTTVFSGPHAEDCFVHASPAVMAMCTHPELDALELHWQRVADENREADKNGFAKVEARNTTLLHGCDGSADAAGCLKQSFSTDMAKEQQHRSVYLATTTDRGDPAVGGPLAQKIAGTYRHREANGDVEGHHYTTTDVLTIKPVGTASIHFDAVINFFNGHTCNLAGGALFRKDGSFVFDDDPKNTQPDEPVCRLALVPDATGIRFKDINGTCNMYCGARGGWNGDRFLFSERVHAAASGR